MTGVQTCALPICPLVSPGIAEGSGYKFEFLWSGIAGVLKGGLPAKGTGGRDLQIEISSHSGGIVPAVPLSGHSQAVGLIDLGISCRGEKQKKDKGKYCRSTLAETQTL